MGKVKCMQDQVQKPAAISFVGQWFPNLRGQILPVLCAGF